MRQFLFLVIISALCVTNASHARAEILKMVFGQLKPYTYQDESTGEIRGASIRYFETIAAKMGYKVEWIGPLPPVRFTQYLKNNSDGALGTVIFPKYETTKTFLYFAEKPCYYSQPILVVRRKSKLTEIRTINDITGYKIGFLEINEPYTPFLEKHRDKLEFDTVASVEWPRINLQKLISSRLDAIFDRNAHTLLFEAKRLHLENNIKILPIPDPATPMYVAFGKAAPNSERLIRQFDKIVRVENISFDYFLKKELDSVTEK